MENVNETAVARAEPQPLTSKSVFWAIYWAQCAFAGTLLVLWMIFQIFEAATRVPGQ